MPQNSSKWRWAWLTFCLTTCLTSRLTSSLATCLIPSCRSSITPWWLSCICSCCWCCCWRRSCISTIALWSTWSYSSSLWTIGDSRASTSPSSPSARTRACASSCTRICASTGASSSLRGLLASFFWWISIRILCLTWRGWWDPSWIKTLISKILI